MTGWRCVLCERTRGVRLFAKGGWDFVRCAACGMVSLDPLPSAADIAAHHERSHRDGIYAAFAAAEEARRAVARRRLALLRPLAPPGSWLDVGCSTGAFVAAAVAAGLAAEGVELASAAVVEARARGLTVHHAPIEDFAPGRRWALVTAFDVVEHLRDPVGFVRRAAGWLEPDGLLALTLPDAASPTARLMGRHWFYYAPPDHVHYFTPPTARRLLETAGLRATALRRVTKPLTLDYAFAQLAQFNPHLGGVARAVGRVLPQALRAREWPLPLGEMLALARAA